MVTSSPAEVFISYSYKDEDLFKEFEKYLSVLSRSGKIRTWHGRQIPFGDEWKEVIDEHIKSADFVLLLVSMDFLVSDYCFNVEFEAAMQRQAIGATRIIPIILRHCPWPQTPVGRFHVLPRDGEPIASSKDIDAAFLHVTNSLRELVESASGHDVIKLITITLQTSQNLFDVEDFTVSLRDDVGLNLDHVAVSIHRGSNKVIIEGSHRELQQIVSALSDPAFRRQLTAGAELKSITYIQGDRVRIIPLEPEVPIEPPEPPRPPIVKYALLLVAIALGVVTVTGFFISWSQPQQVYIHSPTPTPSATSLPTPTVVPSPTPTIPTGVQITITTVPAYSEGGRNTMGHIAGKVSGLKTRDYYVVIYALTSMSVWHVQPTTANSRTDIKPDGTWEANIHLGSKYAAFVVPPNYNPPDKTSDLATDLKGIVAAVEVAAKQ